MSVWTLLQITFNIFCLLAVFLVWIKLRRRQRDDPRLSRGLQLLQSKISVIEDLSDRIETQFNQLSTLLQKKTIDVQKKIEEAQDAVHKIEKSMQKSLEVAKIFQDRIPHQEIIERQNTVKYVEAARMAHQGASPEEIADQVDLPLAEIQLISKVNKDRLMFSEEALPTWAAPNVEFVDEQQSREGVDKSAQEKLRQLQEDFKAVEIPHLKATEATE